LRRKVYIETLGCPKNLVDSEIMTGVLERAGFRVVKNEAQAEVIILNTCAFILPAREEAIAEILRLAEYKEKGSCRLLVMTGCFPQRYGKELQRGLPEVDLFLGTSKIDEIGDFMSGNRGEEKSLVGKPDFLMDSRMPRTLLTPPHIAYLKISEGCSNCCSYCAIPSIRGRLRSRGVDDLLREAETLVRGGARELIVIGQDTTSYGRDRKRSPKLEDLLREIAGLSGDFWIRLMYTYPARITTKLLEMIAAEDKICSYLDMPVQHINDEVLAAMNRRGSGRKIRKTIREARRIIPGVSLRTSLIVGFPGETGKRFIELLEFVREARFEHLGVFAYSPEEGTGARRLRGRVPAAERERRKDVIMSEQAGISREKNQALVGSVKEIIIDGKVPGRGGYKYTGRTRGQAPEVDGIVYVKTARKLLQGDVVRANIRKADYYDLFSEI